MAKGVDLPKPADKGKGIAKATDRPKDEEPVMNGKKSEEKKDGTLPSPKQTPSFFLDFRLTRAMTTTTDHQPPTKSSAKKTAASRTIWT